MSARHDPCFSCRLPDCDESSRLCGLKQAQAAYSQFSKSGRISEAPVEVIEGRSAWYNAYRLEKAARLSEGRAQQ